ncbi:MAG: DUF3597 domain-containing protein [Deefgea sp.]
MSIFSSIKEKIFGRKEEPVATQPAPAAVETTPTPAAPVVTPVVEVEVEVDVAVVVAQMAAEHSEALNWDSSIVDLMKVLNLDSSLANRKELAQELGYLGQLDGSADMNLWLHKQVMTELAKHGGKVPAELQH